MGQIASSARLPVNSRVLAYNTELQMRGNIDDIYCSLPMGQYNRKNESWPMDSIFASVTDPKSSRTRITLKENLALPGTSGQTPARGTEEDFRTLDMTTWQDNYRKVVPAKTYGLLDMEKAQYSLMEKHKDGLGLWNGEEKGLRIRQSFMERYDLNMANATSNVWSQIQPLLSWNPNVFIPGLGVTVGGAFQPVWSSNRATHTNNIVQGLIRTGGLGQFIGRTLTAPVLEDISNYALARRLKRLKIPGLPTGYGFVLTVSELQAALLSNPTVATNNLGSLYVSYERLNDTVQKWRGVIGSYNDILIICDPRQPTLVPTGSAAPFGLTAGYMVWDSTDQRNRTNANVKDTAFLHGAGSIVRVEGEKLHFIRDSQDYDFRNGVGTAGVRGFQLPIFTDADGNMVYDCGALIILDLPNGGAVTSNPPVG